MFAPDDSVEVNALTEETSVADGDLVHINDASNGNASRKMTKKNFVSGIVNADVASGAAIAKSKLAALDIVNADVNASANIALSKLATDPLARANHTGTQAISTITGTLPENQGGTDQTTYAAGDILYASGVNTLAKLAAGSNDQVLTLAGGVPTWADAAGGGGSSITWEAEQSTSSGTSVTVSLIDDGEMLAFWAFAKGNGTDNILPSLQFNSDTGTNYFHTVSDLGSSTSASNDTVIRLARQATSSAAQIVTYGVIYSDPVSEFDSDIVVKFQTTRMIAGQIDFFGAGKWANAGPITSMTLLNDLTGNYDWRLRVGVYT